MIRDILVTKLLLWALALVDDPDERAVLAHGLTNFFYFRLERCGAVPISEMGGVKK